MKLHPLQASVIALALFAAPVPLYAAQNHVPGSFAVAQAEEDSGSDSQRMDAVRKFLAGGKNLAKLDEGRLQQRLKRAQRFQRLANLPSDLAAQLDQEIAGINAEIASKQAGAAAPAGTTAQGAGKSAEQTTAQNAEQTPANQSAGGGAAPGEIDAFLQSVQAVAGMNDQELRQQMRKAAQLSKTQGIAGNQRQQLRQIMLDSRAEMTKRKSGNTAAQTGGDAQPDDGATADATTTKRKQNTQQQTGGDNQGTTTAASSAEVDSFLQSVQPVSGLSDTEIRQQMRRAAQLSKTEGISGEQRQKLRQIMRDSRAAMGKGKNTGAGQAAGGNGNDAAGNDAANQQQAGIDKTKVDAGSERNARSIIDGNTDASQLNKAEQRKRLGTMRDLLSSNQLSPETKKALREKLAAERTVLRGQVGKASGGNDTKVTINNNTTNNNDVVKVVLADRRPPRDLRGDELQLRINVYRDLVINVRYSERERQEWRVILERDRVFLRDRLLEDRRRRQNELKVGAKSGDIKVNLRLDFDPGRAPPPRSVFAAEADDAEIEDILSAPPRQKIDRRYSVEEVETNPDLRDAVARIEIDTVHFGFGEGFLREEEVANLDRIAEIMEEILAVNPGEVFMIEGHTDAVGSDAANRELSRERAKAVKEALSTYYVIPGENLNTVGFGERYLKIPTAEPEAENRRVSVARITALVGALGD